MASSISSDVCNRSPQDVGVNQEQGSLSELHTGLRTGAPLDARWQEMRDMRSKFWQALSLVPGVQVKRMSTLLKVVETERIKRVVFSTGATSEMTSTKNPQETLANLKAWAPALEVNLRNLRIQQTPALSKAIAVVLGQFPMLPELALKFSNEVESRWNELCQLQSTSIAKVDDKKQDTRLKKLQKFFGTHNQEMADTLEQMVKFRDGYLRLRDEFFHENKNLLYTKGNVGEPIKIPDVRQEAMLGLLCAIERFDPARGTQFSTYACRAIQTHSWESGNNHEKTVMRIPDDQRSALRFIQRNGENQGLRALSAEIEASEEVTRALIVAARPPGELPKIQIDERELRPDETLEEKEVRDFFIQKAIGALSERESTILLRRLGLYDISEPMTLQAIAQTFRPAITRERVRQIEERALQKVVSLMRKRFG